MFTNHNIFIIDNILSLKIVIKTSGSKNEKKQSFSFSCYSEKWYFTFIIFFLPLKNLGCNMHLESYKCEKPLQLAHTITMQKVMQSEAVGIVATVQKPQQQCLCL